MDKLISELLGAVLNEQSSAEEAHGALHSYNECFGVLAEKVLEMKTAAVMRNEVIRMVMLNALNDDEPEYIDRIADDLMEKAIMAAAEAVQVAAVCKRIKQH